MEIRRDFYLDKLIKRKNNGLIKVITGIRRCGKSYLLNNLFYHHLLESGVDADHIIRFAFDSADDLYLIGESLIQIEKVRLSVNSLKLILYAILVHPDAISSLHTRCRMKRNALRKSDRSEKLMIPSKRLLSQEILYSPIMMTMVS